MRDIGQNTSSDFCHILQIYQAKAGIDRIGHLKYALLIYFFELVGDILHICCWLKNGELQSGCNQLLFYPQFQPMVGHILQLGMKH